MLFDVIRSLAYGQHVDVWAVLAQVLSVVFVILCILPLHEFAHGWVANKLGDPTAKLEPVNTRYFKHPKRDMAITALAGPVSNLLAALVGAVLVVVMEVFAPYNGVTQFIYNVLYYYVVVNISLAVFNLIPLPPLDGSRIVAAFLSDRAMYTYYRYQNVFVLVMFLLLFSGAMSGPLSTAQNFFARVIFSLAEAPFRLFGAL